MSTETSTPVHSPIHVAPVQSARTGRPTSTQSAAQSALEEHTGPLAWARPTSDGLPVVTSQPRMRRLMGVCGWAALLGGLGLVIGVRGFVGDLLGQAPGWYEPSMIVVGILGIGLTVSAFVTVNRGRLPYALLGAASGVLLTALFFTVMAF